MTDCHRGPIPERMRVSPLAETDVKRILRKVDFSLLLFSTICISFWSTTVTYKRQTDKTFHRATSDFTEPPSTKNVLKLRPWAGRPVRSWGRGTRLSLRAHLCSITTYLRRDRFSFSYSFLKRQCLVH